MLAKDFLRALHESLSAVTLHGEEFVEAMQKAQKGKKTETVISVY